MPPQSSATATVPAVTSVRVTVKVIVFGVVPSAPLASVAATVNVGRVSLSSNVAVCVAVPSW